MGKFIEDFLKVKTVKIITKEPGVGMKQKYDHTTA
jgi:hypothetical protein